MGIGNFQLYYRDKPTEIFRQSIMDVMTASITGRRRPPMSLREELIKAAIEINDQLPDLHIALSGGWESNVCLHTFLEAGIKPQALIIKFPDNLNDFDVNPALETCSKYGIDPVVVDIDTPTLTEFLKSHLLSTAEKYQTYTFFPTLLAYHIDRLKINCIIPDKIDLRRDMAPGGKWNYIRNEGSAWIDRFNQLNSNKVVNNFYAYSAESMLAYLKLPVIEQTVSNPCSGKLSLQSLKHRIYKEGGYKTLPLYTKTVGTDKIVGVNQGSEDAILKASGLKQRVTYIGYEDLVTALENESGKKWQFIL